MNKLEKLYNSIENLKELGVELPKELVQETDRVEEEIIKNEVIPRLTESIEPVVNQIQRNLLLVVEYIPDEPLIVKMTRKRNFSDFNMPTRNINKVEKTNRNTKSFTITTHTKSKKKNLIVEFPNGQKVENRFAYQTLLDVIEIIGVEKVADLNIMQYGLELVSKVEDDFYTQHQIGDWFVVTQTSTEYKKNQIEEISDRLNLNLKIYKE